MKKKIWMMFLLIGLLIQASMTVRAETSYGSSDWSVVFTADNKMVSNFKSSDMSDTIYGIQPGDNVIITLALKNENDTAADWYMTNEILSSLEDSATSASGGAYTYKLVYTSPAGTKTTLYDSDTVGGENSSKAGEGLHQAANGLDVYTYLDTITKGQSGTITLEVALDGDTQGNTYQNTLADLQMRFAVEPNPSAGTNADNSSGNRRNTPGGRAGLVRTGDEMDLTPFIIAASVSGVLLLIFAAYCQMERSKARKGGNAS